MEFYSSIYGLRIRLNQPVPGIAISESSLGALDIDISLGVMPEWFRANNSRSEIWYASQEDDPGQVPRLLISELVDAGHYHVKYSDGTEFLINKSGTRIWATWKPETLTLEDTATYLLGPIMGFVLLVRGQISLHASAIALSGQAVAIVGPAGSGKSTTAAALARLGYSVLGEDVLTVQDLENEFMIQPAYPCIRLWPSSVAALYGSEAQLPRLTPTWDKCYLDLTREQYVFQTEALPLRAIYLLGERSAAASSPSVHEVRSTEALISLIANTYATYLLDKQMRARAFRLLTRIEKKVPIRKVVPHIDPARIDSLCKAILEDFHRLRSAELSPRLREQTLHV